MLYLWSFQGLVIVENSFSNYSRQKHCIIEPVCNRKREKVMKFFDIFLVIVPTFFSYNMEFDRFELFLVEFRHFHRLRPISIKQPALRNPTTHS